MTDLNATVQQDKSTEIFVCNTYFQLCVSLCDVDQKTNTHNIIFYVNDEFVLTQSQVDQVRRFLYPNEFHVISETHSLDKFINLPKMFPAWIRNNLRLEFGSILRRPKASDVLENFQPKNVVKTTLYNTTFFTSKVFAQIADDISVREAGQNSYQPYRIAGSKSIVRFLTGYSPFEKYIGEERWISSIEVPDPTLLPSSLKPKAAQISYEALLAKASNGMKNLIASLFEEYLPKIDNEQNWPIALIATQPIEKLGFCSYEKKIEIYLSIAKRLKSKGYLVLIKPHPSEENFFTREFSVLNKNFPLEIWDVFGLPQINIAISLSSYSLRSRAGFSPKKTITLVEPEKFYASKFDSWDIADKIESIL